MDKILTVFFSHKEQYIIEIISFNIGTANYLIFNAFGPSLPFSRREFSINFNLLQDIEMFY